MFSFEPFGELLRNARIGSRPAILANDRPPALTRSESQVGEDRQTRTTGPEHLAAPSRP